MTVALFGNTGAAVDAAQGAAAPANVLVEGGVFNTTLPTIGNGDVSAIQLDAKGQVLTDVNYVAGSAVSTAATGVQKVGIVGNAGAAVDAAQGATAPANVLVEGGVHNTTLPTVGNGDVSALQLDAAGRLINTSEAPTGTALPPAATLIGGSDATNVQAIGVQTASSQPPSGGYYLQIAPLAYSYKNLAGAATTTVKSGAGTLHEFNINNNDVTATATIYDNTAGSGTIIATITNTVGGGAFIANGSMLHNIAFTTGLTVVTTGTTANYTVVYK
jgi:hypothetical protein